MMGTVMEMSMPFKKRWIHKLFRCSNYCKFWRPYPFRCPVCNHGYRCYWDGSDVNHLINVCRGCAPQQYAIEKSKKSDRLTKPSIDPNKKPTENKSKIGAVSSIIADPVKNLEQAVKQTVDYLYPIKGEVSPETYQAIARLRQLINEEFKPEKLVSSQFIYDILKGVLK